MTVIYETEPNTSVRDRIADLEARFAALKKAYESEQTENAKLRAKMDNSKKLSDPEIARIRKLWDTGGWTQKELATAFCVNPATISRIVRGLYHA